MNSKIVYAFLFIILLNPIPSLSHINEIRMQKEINVFSSEVTTINNIQYFSGFLIPVYSNNSEEIELASFSIDIAPFEVEKVESFQQNEFEIVYEQNNSVLNINIKRLNLHVDETQQRVMNIYCKPFSYRQIKFGFGEFDFQSAIIKIKENVNVEVVTQNGSWFFSTDYYSTCKFRLISASTREPLQDFRVYVTGYNEIQNLFIEPHMEWPTDSAGYTELVFFPESNFLYEGDNDCKIPRIECLDFWLLIESPEGSEYETQTAKVTVPLRTSCGDFEPFKDVTLELSPISRTCNWECYE